MNSDAGGAFGACAADGFCNLFDANHTLTAFAGTSACACPMAATPEQFPATAGETPLILIPERRSVPPGGLVAVAVFAGAALSDLQSYQLHLVAGGGSHGALQLVDIIIEERPDAAFAGGKGVFKAFNVARGQMLAGLSGGGVPTADQAYLATYVYRVSGDARGAFVVDASVGDVADAATYLVSDFTDAIDVLATQPAIIIADFGITTRPQGGGPR